MTPGEVVTLVLVEVVVLDTVFVPVVGTADTWLAIVVLLTAFTPVEVVALTHDVVVVPDLSNDSGGMS